MRARRRPVCEAVGRKPPAAAGWSSPASPCGGAEERCFFGVERLLPTVATPLFVIQSTVENWALANLLRLPCFDGIKDHTGRPAAHLNGQRGRAPA